MKLSFKIILKLKRIFWFFRFKLLLFQNEFSNFYSKFNLKLRVLFLRSFQHYNDWRKICHVILNIANFEECIFLREMSLWYLKNCKLVWYLFIFFLLEGTSKSDVVSKCRILHPIQKILDQMTQEVQFPRTDGGK